MAVLLLINSCSLNSGLVKVGTAEDISFANQLWNEMDVERLVGNNAQPDNPFIGAAPPHGWVLEVLYRDIEVEGHTGFVVVKRNYNPTEVGGPNPTIEQVSEDRMKYLDSYTVMYQRESGYDRDNQDWFWVKYKPNGKLFVQPIGGKPTSTAGRLVKGRTVEQNRGCIYCHRSAGGGDYIFYPHILKPKR